MASQTSKELMQMLYVAYYGRPADPSGLDFWAQVVDVAGGQISTSTMNAFGTSQEYTDRFGTLSNEQLIDNLYQQMFGRAADSAGKTFYLDLLNTGQSTLAEIALDIANGAQGTDKTTLDNRVTAAQYFTDQVEAQGVSYTSANISDVQAMLAKVTDDPVTVVQVEQEMDTFISTTLGGTTGTGQAFTLTDSASGSGTGDNITGTSGDDTITGGPTTLDNDDVINGGAGTDTLRAELDGTTVAPTIKNVEGLTFANAGFAGASLIFTNIEVSAATSVVFEVVGGGLSASQLPEGMSATLQNWGAGQTAWFTPANAGNTNSINLTVKDLNSAHLNFPSYETVTLNVRGTNDVVLGGTTGGLQGSATLVLEGTSVNSSVITLEDVASANGTGFLWGGNSGVIQGSAFEGTFDLVIPATAASANTINLGNVEGADRIILGSGLTGAINVNGLTGGQNVYLGLTARSTALLDFNVRSAGNTANTADALDVFVSLNPSAQSTGNLFEIDMSGMTGIEVLNFNVTTASNSAALLLQLTGNDNSGIDINSINFVSDPGLASATISGAVLNGGTALQSLSFTGATATDIRVNQIDNGNATAGITVLGGGGDDYFAADSADLNSVFTLNGGAGNDTLIGGGVDDVALGSADTLSAMTAGGLDSVVAGDSIVGGAGNDWIVGGLGADTMEGGAGNDVFVFFIEETGMGANAAGNASAGQADVIKDFKTGDIIFLKGWTSTSNQSPVSTGGAFGWGIGVTAAKDHTAWFGGTLSSIWTGSITALDTNLTGAGIGNVAGSALAFAVYVSNGDTYIEFTTSTASGVAMSAGEGFVRIRLQDFSQGISALGARATDTGIEIFSLV